MWSFGAMDDHGMLADQRTVSLASASYKLVCMHAVSALNHQLISNQIKLNNNQTSTGSSVLFFAWRHENEKNSFPASSILLCLGLRSAKSPTAFGWNSILAMASRYGRRSWRVHGITYQTAWHNT